MGCAPRRERNPDLSLLACEEDQVVAAVPVHVAGEQDVSRTGADAGQPDRLTPEPFSERERDVDLSRSCPQPGRHVVPPVAVEVPDDHGLAGVDREPVVPLAAAPDAAPLREGHVDVPWARGAVMDERDDVGPSVAVEVPHGQGSLGRVPSRAGDRGVVGPRHAEVGHDAPGKRRGQDDHPRPRGARGQGAVHAEGHPPDEDRGSEMEVAGRLEETEGVQVREVVDEPPCQGRDRDGQPDHGERDHHETTLLARQPAEQPRQERAEQEARGEHDDGSRLGQGDGSSPADRGRQDDPEQETAGDRIDAPAGVVEGAVTPASRRLVVGQNRCPDEEQALQGQAQAECAHDQAASPSLTEEAPDGDRHDGDDQKRRAQADQERRKGVGEPSGRFDRVAVVARLRQQEEARSEQMPLRVHGRADELVVDLTPAAGG